MIVLLVRYKKDRIILNIHCDPCNPGTYSDVLGLADCKPCYQGSFQELSGGHNCSLTHAGYYPRQDRAAQIPCVLNYYLKPEMYMKNK